MKKVIILFISIVLVFFLSIFYIVNNNKSYKEDLLEEVNKNYAKDVVYANKYGNNYVVKTKEAIVVLNDKYEEVTGVSIEESVNLEYNLVYRKNAIMYQKSEVKGNTIIYTYYDIKTGEEIDKVEIEG